MESTLTYAILIEIIIALSVWVVILLWRNAKRNKKPQKEQPEEPAFTNFEIYLQYLNRELSDTKAHLDELEETLSTDTDSINMYRYRLLHLEAECEAMEKSDDDVVKFWALYRDAVSHLFKEEVESETDAATKNDSEPEAVNIGFDSVQQKSNGLVEHSDNIIELVTKLEENVGSEELKHMIDMLITEKAALVSEMQKMESEYQRLMQNSALQTAKVIDTTQSDRIEVSSLESKQNKRVNELSELAANLSLELQEKESLLEQTAWVERRFKEMEQVVFTLEDENNFLREQIKALLD